LLRFAIVTIVIILLLMYGILTFIASILIDFFRDSEPTLTD